MELYEIKKRMFSEKLYRANDENLMKEQAEALLKLNEFNLTKANELSKREKLLKEMFKEIGEGCYIEPQLHANWAGKFAHLGKNVYAKFNLTMVDDGEIFVGDNVMFGPNVTLCTETHLVLPKLRKTSAQYNNAIHIGNNVWLGASVTVLPGVRIGDNSIIGAGSVVTKDIHEYVIAFGNPCKVHREITEDDEKIYDKYKLIDLD